MSASLKTDTILSGTVWVDCYCLRMIAEHSFASVCFGHIRTLDTTAKHMKVIYMESDDIQYFLGMIHDDQM